MTVAVMVDDINEFAPKFSEEGYEATVTEIGVQNTDIHT